MERIHPAVTRAGGAGPVVFLTLALMLAAAPSPAAAGLSAADTFGGGPGRLDNLNHLTGGPFAADMPADAEGVDCRTGMRIESSGQSFGVAPVIVVTPLTPSGYEFDAPNDEGPADSGGPTPDGLRRADVPAGRASTVPDSGLATLWLLPSDEVPPVGEVDYTGVPIEMKAAKAAVPPPPAAWSAAAFGAGLAGARVFRALRRLR